MIWNFVAGALVLLTLPALSELVLLTVGAVFASFKKKNSAMSSSIPSKMVVIIPAYNEEAGIQRTIHSLKCCRGLFEIIVLADNCTDLTASKARESKVRVLERVDPNRQGKHHALHFAFDILQKEDFHHYLIIDADTVVSPNLIEEIQKEFGKGADAVQVFYGILNGEASLRLRMMKIAFLAFNHIRPLGRGFWGFSSGISGNGIAFSRKTLQAVPFKLDSIVEDLAYHLRLVEAGKKVEYIDSAKVWAEMPLHRQAMANQKIRWEGGRLRTAYQELPKLLRRLFQGNFELAEPCLDLMTLPLSFLVLMLIILAVLPIYTAHVYAILGLALVFFQVITGMVLGRCGWRDYAALAAVPLYLLWKLLFIGKIAKAVFKGLPWNRTQRTGENKPG